MGSLLLGARSTRVAMSSDMRYMTTLTLPRSTGTALRLMPGSSPGILGHHWDTLAFCPRPSVFQKLFQRPKIRLYNALLYEQKPPFLMAGMFENADKSKGTNMCLETA